MPTQEELPMPLTARTRYQLTVPGWAVVSVNVTVPPVPADVPGCATARSAQAPDVPTLRCTWKPPSLGAVSVQASATLEPVTAPFVTAPGAAGAPPPTMAVPLACRERFPPLLL